jgi:hypothetical protein
VHNDCPTPHHGCVMKKCVVPSWHPLLRSNGLKMRLA